MLRTGERRNDESRIRRVRFNTRGHLTVVNQAGAKTEERAEHLRSVLQEHGLKTQAKTDLDGSIWLRFTHDRRVYDIIVTADTAEPRCMLLTHVDRFSTQDERARYMALERINSANLQTTRGCLVLTPLGSVNAMAVVDDAATAEDILSVVDRLSVAINAYGKTAA